ncbi:hypothetical protein PoB_000856500 [Plakobranchus ocellatus]|uniref:Uncharacterized protein n=1 Tax=Plakobranchus ocellatus TaxID=259542 RepID=A0AAV3YHR6_9GAST|nr:hypothetical protein PoB_000856500 [Plakobranchus ocellatus]
MHILRELRTTEIQEPDKKTSYEYVLKEGCCDDAPIFDGLVSAASLAVVEDDEERSSCDNFCCEVLPELTGCGSKKTVHVLGLVMVCGRSTGVHKRSWQALSPLYSLTALILQQWRSTALR